MTSRYLFKCAASILATVLGAMLLVADGDPGCDSFGAFQASLDFTSDCSLVPNQGHLSLNFGEQDASGAERARQLVEQQLKSAEFDVSSVKLDFLGCVDGKDDSRGQLGSITFSLGGATGSPSYSCDTIAVPITESRTVICRAGASADARQGDAGGTEAATCSITFQPAAM